MITRRRLLASLGTISACSRRPKAKGFDGLAFVANAGGGAVAAVDLTALAVVRHIRVQGNPHQVLTRAQLPWVFAVMPDTATVSAVDPSALRVQAQRRLPVTPGWSYLEPTGERLWVLAAEAPRVVAVRSKGLEIERTVELPHPGVDVDFGPLGSPSAGLAAVSLGDGGEVVAFDTASGRLERRIKVEGKLGSVRFRRDGRQLLIANRSEREMAIYDLRHHRQVVRLPLSVSPDLCSMKGDGGQLFVAGAGADAVVTVYPYQTEVGSITLAGRAPGFLTTSEAPDYLFVTNPQSDGVTVVNIATQKVMAVASVGKAPCFVAITPNNEYALVLNRQSGDIAVLHIGSMTARRTKSIPLLTMIPVGSEPVSAVVRAL